MKTITVKKRNGKLEGCITLPSSKSISNRLLLIRAMTEGNFNIENLSDADDTLLLSDLLAKINNREGAVTELDTANAGTVMRFLTAYLSMVPGKWILTGSERMKQRPIGVLVDGLISLGAKIDYLAELGYPPLMIHGTSLKGREIILDPGISSQFVSALILIGPRIPGGLTLHLSGPAVSFPYVKMTIGLLKDFGILVKEDRSKIRIPEGKYLPVDHKVESDWSAAAFWYEAASLASDVDLELPGLLRKSIQGDSVVNEIFRSFNVQTEFTGTGIHLTKSTLPLQKEQFRFNFSDHPDIAPAVITSCAMLGMHGLFTGLKTLRIKETDRLQALKSEYQKIGITAETDSSGSLTPMEIIPHKIDFPSGLQIKTYGDHRMAMTFAPLALLNEISIEDPDVVTKSYPGFWHDLISVGYEIV